MTSNSYVSIVTRQKDLNLVMHPGTRLHNVINVIIIRTVILFKTHIITLRNHI